MEKLVTNICQVCGGKLKDCGDHFKCESCDTEYRIDSSLSQAEQNAIFRKYNAFEDAERELKLSPPRFDDAEIQFENLIREYPDWSAGYWGLLRAKFGIKFERDSSGDAVPSCYKSTYEDVRDTDEFKKAVELAETPALRGSYRSMADYIADVAEKWRKETQQYDYDVFISFKASDDADGSETADTREMQNLCTFLTQNGFRVFFSPVALKEYGIGGRQSEPYIFNALDKAQALIVYGSRKEYFTSTWVQNEWQRYLRAMEHGRKPDDSLIVLYQGFNPKELPQGLRRIQALDYASRTVYSEILGALGRIFAQVREREHSPTLERVHIEAGKVGKRNATVGERIGTVQLGSAMAPKSAKRSVISVQTRELGVSSHVVAGRGQDMLRTALQCLRIGAFDDAASMFDASLRENDKNGDLWLGKLCADIHDGALYDEVKGAKSVSEHSAEIISDYNVLRNAIDFAADKSTAERLLSFVYEQLRRRLAEGSGALSKADAETVFNLYKLCGDYKSENAERMRDCLLQYISRLTASDATELLDYLFARIPSVQKLLNALEETTKQYMQLGNFDRAKRYNDRILELDEANGNALMNRFYIANCKSGRAAFISSASGVHDLSILEEGLPKISKKDAQDIIGTLCEAESALMQVGYFDAARRLFQCIVKYDFDGRDAFLQRHAACFGQLAESKADRSAFFEEILAAYPDRSAKFHIESRLTYAKTLQKHDIFQRAEAMYNTVLNIESENYRALAGILLCKLHIGGSKKVSDVQWGNWDQALFERILAACPNQRAQAKFVDDMCSWCIAAMRHPTGVANGTGATTAAQNKAAGSSFSVLSEENVPKERKANIDNSDDYDYWKSTLYNDDIGYDG